MESGKTKKQNIGKTIEYEDSNQKFHVGTILKEGKKRIKIETSTGKPKWIFRKQVIRILEM